MDRPSPVAIPRSGSLSRQGFRRKDFLSFMSKSWLDWQSRVSIQITPVGKGVFASRSFRKGQVIGLITGNVFSDTEYGSNYCIDLGEHRSLEPIEPFRFLNHSCEPNCQMFTVNDGDESLQLCALRTIRPGEQLLIDYAWPADSAIECLCGTHSCRGWIVCPTELHLVKKRRRKPDEPSYSTAGN